MCFTIKQCQIKIEYLFFAVITFFLFTDQKGVALLGMAATVLHEGGHLVMLLLLKTPIQTIRFHAFGVDIVEKSGRNRSYLEDMLVALSGPLANMIFCVGSAIVCLFVYNQLVWEFMLVNGTIALFHMLPVESLDGGQALYALLCHKFSHRTCETVVMLVSFFVLLPVAILGFLMLLQSQYNYSLLFLSVYLMCLLVLKQGRFF